jgi:hypothetical protein
VNPFQRKLLELLDGAAVLMGEANGVRDQTDGLRDRMLDLDRQIKLHADHARQHRWLKPESKSAGAKEYRAKLQEREATRAEFERLMQRNGELRRRAADALEPIRLLVEPISRGVSMPGIWTREPDIHDLRQAVLRS